MLRGALGSSEVVRRAAKSPRPVVSYPGRAVVGVFGGLSSRFASRALRVLVVAWGRGRRLARASCRHATCFVGFPGQPVSRSDTSIAVHLHISSSNHQQHHTSRGECRLSERGRVPLTAPGLWAMEATKANKQREESQQRLLILFTTNLNRRNFFLCPTGGGRFLKRRRLFHASQPQIPRPALPYYSCLVPCYLFVPTTSPLTVEVPGRHEDQRGAYV